MGLQMIDRDEGQASRGGQRLCRHHADQHAADQARPGGRRDGVQIVPADARLLHRPGDHRIDLIQVGAGRHLGHHAGEGLVVGQLLMDDVGQHRARVRHDGGGGFVTTGFDPENTHKR